MEALVYILVFIAGCYVGNIYTLVQARREELRLVKDVEDRLAALKEKIVSCKIEVVGGMLYLYTTDDDTFIAQGKNMKELDAAAKRARPNTLFNVPQKNIDEVSSYK
jgi:hypothetical protein